MRELRVPVEPVRFVSRARTVFLSISFCQLCFIVLFSELNLAHVISLLVVVGVGLAAFFAIGLRARTLQTPVLNPFFLPLFILSFFCVILFSRLDYVITFHATSLLETRGNEALGRGGLYSVFTIMFYVLCIIATLTKLRYRTYWFCVVAFFIVALIDVIALGTRNAPFFVMLFFLLSVRVHFRLRTVVPSLLIGAILLAALFDYQTQGRSLDTITVGWDWRTAMEYTWIAENLPMRSGALNFIDDWLPSAYPLLYFLLYISHSVSELSYFLSNASLTLFGDALYVRDQLCIAFGCDRDALQAAMAVQNPRLGIYQTIYPSLLIDFGLLGTLFFFVVILLGCWAKNNGPLDGLKYYATVIALTSGIENYLYNGLGFNRAVIFVALWYLLTHRFHFVRHSPALA